MNQKVIDRAVNIATKTALNGYPVKQVVWIPSNVTKSPSEGTFVVEYAGPLKATETAPWD